MFFDLVKFFADRVAAPRRLRWHEFMQHHELSFDRRDGTLEFRDKIKNILAAGSTIFELKSEGNISRIGTPGIQAGARDLQPKAGEDKLDTLNHLGLVPLFV